MNNKILITAFFVAILYMLSATFADNHNVSAIKVPAVSSEGQGVITEVEAEIIQGRGRILLNTEPFGGVQLQNSERVAVQVAENFTGKNLSDKDIIITFKAEAFVVDGPSAGGAMTIAAISAIEGKELRNDTTMTGTIQPDGSIGPVSSIFEKAKAAHDNGFEIFLIPKGQELQAFNVERVETPAPGLSIIRSSVQYRNVTRFAAENWNLTIIQVSDIKDVYDVILARRNATLRAKIEGQTPSSLKEAALTQEVSPMFNLARSQILIAEAELAQAKEKLLKSKLDSKTLEDALDLLKISESELSDAKSALNSNYLYGAANHAFKAAVLSKSASDIIEFNSLSSAAQKSFLNKRSSEASIVLRKAQQKLSDISIYETDTGSYEWAVAAQNRLAQAEQQLDQLEEADNIFNALSLAEGWADISVSLYEIAKESQSGEKFDKKIFANSSAQTIINVADEVQRFTLPPTGVVWLLQVSEREYNKQWYLAAYVDSNTALSRIETQRALNVRNFEDLSKYAESQINSIEEKNSAWAKLYKEQAKLNLFYAQRNQDSEFIDDALMFASQAKVYSDLAEKVSTAPRVAKFQPSEFPTLLVIVLVGVFAAGYYLYRVFHKPEIKPKKRRV